jgi:formate-dependent nitrite reductase membrane component NrfD
VGYAVTVIGIPSAFLLHGYVGFIFGSVKANPWWSTPLMPVVFLFSAMVSGIAAVMVLYVVSMKLRKRPSICAAWIPSPLPVLHLRHRFHPGDAGPDAPHL